MKNNRKHISAVCLSMLISGFPFQITAQEQEPRKRTEPVRENRAETPARFLEGLQILFVSEENWCEVLNGYAQYLEADTSFQEEVDQLLEEKNLDTLDILASQAVLYLNEQDSQVQQDWKETIERIQEKDLAFPLDEETIQKKRDTLHKTRQEKREKADATEKTDASSSVENAESSSDDHKATETIASQDEETSSSKTPDPEVIQAVSGESEEEEPQDVPQEETTQVEDSEELQEESDLDKDAPQDDSQKKPQGESSCANEQKEENTAETNPSSNEEEAVHVVEISDSKEDPADRQDAENLKEANSKEKKETQEKKEQEKQLLEAGSAKKGELNQIQAIEETVQTTQEQLQVSGYEVVKVPQMALDNSLEIPGECPVIWAEEQTLSVPSTPLEADRSIPSGGNAGGITGGSYHAKPSNPANTLSISATYANSRPSVFDTETLNAYSTQQGAYAGNSTMRVLNTANKTISINGLGTCKLLPDYTNSAAWRQSVSSYNTPSLWGQCTWFAWGRFYELYGFDPGFTGNGYQCVSQLLAAHPDKFELSKNPASGAVFSSDIFHNHVGIVLEYDQKTNILTIQEGNLDFVSNPDWNEAIADYRTVEVTPETMRSMYGNVTYAVPKAGIHYKNALKTLNLREMVLNALKRQYAS